MWWVGYKVVTIGEEEYFLPTALGMVIIESNNKPEGNFAGPFHCRECAIICMSFGKTIAQAWEAKHGSDDEKFCVWLGEGAC